MRCSRMLLTVRVNTNLTASAALVHENITVRHFKLNLLHWKIAAACSPFVIKKSYTSMAESFQVESELLSIKSQES